MICLPSNNTGVCAFLLELIKVWNDNLKETGLDSDSM